ncbi:MAG: DUF2096 family protein [Candidatus Hydrothermarchaeales archaeon]
MSFSSRLNRVGQLWFATMKMATELKREGIETDLSKLKMSKMILNQCKSDRHPHMDALMDADEMITDVQKDLFIAAEPLGRDFISKWEEEFKEVREGRSSYIFPTPSSRFIPGLPRDKNWVRVDISGILEPDEMEDIARSCGTKIQRRDGGYVLITGSRAAMKKTLDAISEKLKE